MSRTATAPGAGAANIARRRASARAEGSPAYHERRREIIAAAGGLFLERGYRTTSFRDIAEAVGLDRASLYYYFASKQELFQTATEAAVTRNVEAVERIAAGADPPGDKVAEVLALLLESYAETDYPFMFIFLQEDVNRMAGDSSSRWARTVRALARRYEAAVTRIFEDGTAAGAFASVAPPALLTKALLGMANWSHRWYRPSGPLSHRQIAEAFAAILLDGIAPKRAGPARTPHRPPGHSARSSKPWPTKRS